MKNFIWVIFSLFAAGFVLADNATDNKIPSVENIFTNRIEKLRIELQDIEKEAASSEAVLLELKKEVTSNQQQARLIVISAPEMNSNYVLVESEYYLDGRKISSSVKENSRNTILNQIISPGKHQLKVEKLYRQQKTALEPVVTFRVKNNISVAAAVGEITEVDVISFSKTLRKGQDKLAIRFDVKQMPLSDLDRVSILIESALSKQQQVMQNSRLAIILPNVEVPGLVLLGSVITLDSQIVASLQPALATYKGQVIYDSQVELGSKKIQVSVSYKVSGQLAKLWKTSEIKFKFDQDFEAKAGYKTTLLLNGLSNPIGVKSATVFTENVLNVVTL